MTTKMYSYKRERAKRLYPEPAIFNISDVLRREMVNLNVRVITVELGE